MDKKLNNNMKNSMSKIFGDYGMVVVLVAMIVIFAIAVPNGRFLTEDNIFNVLRQVSIVGVLAVGMTFVMLTGGIDLSVGSVAGFAGVAAALMMTEYSVDPVLASLIVLAFGTGLGLASAFFISKLQVPPFIATLGMMVSVRGIAYIITGGLPVFGFDPTFKELGQGYVGPIPIPVIIMAIAFAFGVIFLTKTRLGRHIYGVGGNEEASRLSGVNVTKIKFLVYGVGGFMSALGGLIVLARTNSGQPNAGEGYEMDVITSVVLGGVSMAGGQGRIYMVIVGVLIMGILVNGMTMIGISEFVQQFVKGMVLIAAVAFDSFIKGRKAKNVAA